MSVVISPQFVLNQTETGLNGQPLTHARIGYQNLVTTDNVNGPSGVTGFDVENVALDQTYETYKPTTTNPTVTIDLESGFDINYFGVCGRNLGGIRLQSSTNGSSWTTRSEKNDGFDVVSMGLFKTVLARYWRITFYGSGQEIINISIGKTLDMMRPLYGGHAPLKMSRQTAVRPNISEGGEWLGRTIKRKGFATSFSYQNLQADWVRAEFDPFIESARTKPFYIAWRPELYPDEVGYCWINSDIKPVNSGVRDLMSVDFSVEGYDVTG